MYNNNYIFIVKIVRNDFFFFVLGYNNLVIFNIEIVNLFVRYFKVYV